jgi:GH24 family phage-related lysozyme (muramidase)
METKLRERIESIIKADEGLRLVAYQDSRGIWTIGYGYNLEAHGFTPPMAARVRWTREKAEAEFDVCFDRCLSSLNKNFPTWTNLSPARQAVAISAMYQLGAAKVLQFAPTIKHIVAHEYEDAAQHMLASAWGKQTPARVKRLATMMRTGEWLS